MMWSITRDWGGRVVKVCSPCYLGYFGEMTNKLKSAAYTTLLRESMSQVMRARVTRAVIAIVGMTELRGRRGNRHIIMIILTIMIMGRGIGMGMVEKGRGGQGVRMRMRRCLSIRAGVERIRDKASWM